MRTLAMILVVLGAAGCTTTLQVTDRAVAHGTSSAITSPERDIITTQAQWESLWANHTATGAALDANGAPMRPPSVDLSKETVVAVFEGDKPTTCHDIRIAGGGVDGENLTVNVVAYDYESQGGACGQAFTQPFDIHAFSGSFARGHVLFDESTSQAAPP